MKNIKLLLLFFTIFFIVSCNLLSFKNISNDYRWKKKKFVNSVNLRFIYSPILFKQVGAVNSFFFYKADLKNLDKQYKVESMLIKKFKNRNILLSSEGIITLKIDTVLFRGYSEMVSVYSNDLDNEYLGTSEKQYFMFKLSGCLMKKDSCISKIEVEKKHNTEPRESFLFSGVIVDGGIGAQTNKMIENTINEFSYRAYLKLKEMQY
jgi:hypothetical protein